MHLGEIKFKQKSSKDDQAQPTDKASGDKVAKLLGLETSLLFENFVKPKIKVNTTHYNRISGGKLSFFNVDVAAVGKTEIGLQK